MKLIVRRHFDAAHKLVHYTGPCNRLHGHTWKVDVELEIDEPNQLTGDAGYYKQVTIDFKGLKESIDCVLPDHQYLNDWCEFEPTAENLALCLRRKIGEAFSVKAKRLTVRVWESEDCCAEAGE